MKWWPTKHIWNLMRKKNSLSWSIIACSPRGVWLLAIIRNDWEHIVQKVSSATWYHSQWDRHHHPLSLFHIPFSDSFPVELSTCTGLPFQQFNPIAFPRKTAPQTLISKPYLWLCQVSGLRAVDPLYGIYCIGFKYNNYCPYFNTNWATGQFVWFVFSP